MATKTTTRPDPAAKKSAGGALAERKGRSVSTDVMSEDDMAAFAGQGFENVTSDHIAIPFLAVLQSNSPQCDPDSGDFIKAARAGMIFNTVTKEIFDGKDGILVVPCAHQQKYLRWTPREKGGGFKGDLTAEQVAIMRSKGQLIDFENRTYFPLANGAVDPEQCDKVSDTRVWYVLLLHPDTGEAMPAVLSMASTQIKKSRQLMSLLDGLRFTRSDGARYKPAMFCSVIRVSTTPESNAKGKWSGLKFEVEGRPDSNAISMAQGFNRMVSAGRAQANFEAAGEGGSEGGRGDERF